MSTNLLDTLQFRNISFAKFKFWSAVALRKVQKDGLCLINSGGTHHFFHAKDNFLDYHTIYNQSVQSVAGYSKIIETDTVRLPFDKNITFKACRAPSFSANIISVGMPNKMYNILFTGDSPVGIYVSTCIESKRNDKQTIKYLKKIYGPYYVQPNYKQ